MTKDFLQWKALSCSKHEERFWCLCMVQSLIMPMMMHSTTIECTDVCHNAPYLKSQKFHCWKPPINKRRSPRVFYVSRKCSGVARGSWDKESMALWCKHHRSHVRECYRTLSLHLRVWEECARRCNISLHLRVDFYIYILRDWELWTESQLIIWLPAEASSLEYNCNRWSWYNCRWFIIANAIVFVYAVIGGIVAFFSICIRRSPLSYTASAFLTFLADFVRSPPPLTTLISIWLGEAQAP